MMVSADVSTMGVPLVSPPAESSTGFYRVVIPLARLGPKPSGSLPQLSRYAGGQAFTAPQARFMPDLTFSYSAGRVFVLIEAKGAGQLGVRPVRPEVETAAGVRDFLREYALEAALRTILDIAGKALPKFTVKARLIGHGDESDVRLVMIELLANKRGAEAFQAEQAIALKALLSLGDDIANRFVIVVR